MKDFKYRGFVFQIVIITMLTQMCRLLGIDYYWLSYPVIFMFGLYISVASILKLMP